MNLSAIRLDGAIHVRIHVDEETLGVVVVICVSQLSSALDESKTGRVTLVARVCAVPAVCLADGHVEGGEVVCEGSVVAVGEDEGPDFLEGTRDDDGERGSDGSSVFSARPSFVFIRDRKSVV